MEMKEANERARKLKNLEWSTLKNGAKLGLQTSGLLFLCNLLVVAVDILYVHNRAFAIVGGGVNAFFILRRMARETLKERDRVREEVKKILSE